MRSRLLGRTHNLSTLKPSPTDILAFIASQEPLRRTLERFPELTRSDLQALLEAVAKAARVKEERSLQTEERSLPAKEATTALLYPKLCVFSDGAARGNPGPAGAGAVLTREDGQIVDRSGKYLGSQTNNYAEYMGLLLGLQRALVFGAREVEVFADSELMIRQLQGRYQVRAPNLRPLFEEARALLKNFTRVSLKHIPREKNAAADEMSNRAIDEEL